MAFHAMERLGVARMEDVGVPRGRVPELLAAIERIGRGAGPRRSRRSATSATATSTRTSSSTATIPDGEAKLERATDALYRAAIALGGTVTAEHGIGLARRDYLGPPARRGSGSDDAGDQDALDPLGILNPGKVLPEA